jgi:hypothetical protein
MVYIDVVSLKSRLCAYRGDFSGGFGGQHRNPEDIFRDIFAEFGMGGGGRGRGGGNGFGFGFNGQQEREEDPAVSRHLCLTRVCFLCVLFSLFFLLFFTVVFHSMPLAMSLCSLD